jgi:hypothetical protein
MTAPNLRHGRNAGQETSPPQNDISGGPETPPELLGAEVNAESERQAAGLAGHPGAQASAEELQGGASATR